MSHKRETIVKLNVIEKKLDSKMIVVICKLHNSQICIKLNSNISKQIKYEYVNKNTDNEKNISTILYFQSLGPILKKK